MSLVMALGCGSAQRLCQDAERCGQVAAQRCVAGSFQLLGRSISQDLGHGPFWVNFMRLYNVRFRV